MIVVNADGVVARGVVSEQRPAQAQSVVVPTAHLFDKIPQNWVLHEILAVCIKTSQLHVPTQRSLELLTPVLVVGFQGQVYEGRGSVFSRAPVAADGTSANARVVGLVFGIVKDALDGLGSGLQDAAGSHHSKVLLAALEDVLPGKQPLEENIAVLLVLLAQVFDRLVWRRRNQGCNLVRVQLAVVDIELAARPVGVALRGCCVRHCAGMRGIDAGKGQEDSEASKRGRCIPV